MVNYENSIIYKLCCKNTEIKEIYIGSTTNFRRRKYSHKFNCLNKMNIRVYNFMNENGGWKNWDMIFIEKVKVNCKLELGKIEREYIEKYHSNLNHDIPTRTPKEYYRDNKEKFVEKVNCECGSTFIKHNILRHKKSKKHLKFIQSLNLI